MSSGRSSSAPRTSIVIPCHESLRWLPQTLRSVLDQSDRDLEVVLVDDGGTDDLVGFVAGVGDDRVRLVRQDNAGVSAARNRGLDEARGALVLFLDSDDLLLPGAVEALVGRFDRDPEVGLVYGWAAVIDEHGVEVSRRRTSDWEGDVWERLTTKNVVSLGAAIAPARLLRELGGFTVNRDRFAVDVEDWELWLRVADGHRFALVPEVVLQVRRHEANSTGGGATATLDAAYRHLIESVFRDQPPHRAALRRGMTARAEMALSWHSLQDDLDAERALAYRRSAVRHEPSVRSTREYWRLGAAIRLLQLGGAGVYGGVRRATGALRRAAV
jgi:glycosyltransferase involved in cell wall biosynthesis